MADNNLIEQDHRSIKLRLGPMLGLKRFRCASITIAGQLMDETFGMNPAQCVRADAKLTSVVGNNHGIGQ